MKVSSCLYGVLFLAVCFACEKETSDPAPMLILPVNFDFNEGEHGWAYGFADLPAGAEDSALFELKYAYTDQPAESKLTKRSIMLSGKNVNRDLFMYLKKKIQGLEPNTDYTITFNVELASNLNLISPAGMGSVYLKAGATDHEPLSVIRSGAYVLNVDKGNGAISGKDLISLGDIFTQATTTGYSLINRNNTMSNTRYVARTNSDGELWIIVGTDSTKDGTTSVFYSRINIVFSVS